MLAAAVLAADLSTTLDLSERSEARLRSTQVPGTMTPMAVDLLEEPAAKLLAKDRRWELTLGYTADLMLPGVQAGLAPLVLQTGSVGVAWHDRKLRLSLNEDATYGLENSAYLLTSAPAQGGQPVTGQPPPVTTLAAAPPATILFGSTRTAAMATYRFDPRTTMMLDAELFLYGGLDAASQATLPEQVGERAFGTFDHALTRSDVLETAVNAQHVDFTQTPCVPLTGTINPAILCEPDDAIAQAMERLRHTLSRTETLTVGAGAAVSEVREHSDVPYQTAYYPVGEAIYAAQLDRAGSRLTLTARLAPYLDIRTGIVLNAMLGEVALVERLSPPLTFTMTLGGSQNLPTEVPAAASIVRGDVSMEYRFNRQVLLALGERAFWENENGLGSFATAFFYVAVTVREPTLRF
jgi:hypothetical protein